MFFYTVEKPPRLSEFDLEVPENLIAKHPSKKRDNCKLMVLNKKEETIQHMKFSDIHQFFKKGDVLLNSLEPINVEISLTILYNLWID